MFSRIARENLAALAPGARAPDREGADAPVAVMRAPVGADSPERAIGIADVHDVRVAVDQQHSLLALALLLQQVEQPTELGGGAVAEFGENRGVKRRLFQLMDSELGTFNILFNQVEEKTVEVASSEADVRGLQLVLDDELLGASDLRSGDPLEQLWPFEYQIVTKKRFSSLHSSQLIENRLNRTQIQSRVLHRCLKHDRSFPG